ncbi:MAG: M81 family metallopeptidase, partial [Rhodobacteraceae bacterium]|nr:M81 family metallopeptidase [Paracoccaceae bacterium]
MRVGLIHVLQETNDFNPMPTTLDDYRSFGLVEGEAIPRRFGRLGQVGGHYAAVAEAGMAVETVPLIRGFTVAGGRITAEAFEHFQRRIAEGLRAAGRLDGLALQLHGACAAAGEDDVEGAQAALCRSILGPGVPIVLSLDHHANLTARMVAAVDAVVAHRTQPHDTFDTGRIGTALLLR